MRKSKDVFGRKLNKVYLYMDYTVVAVNKNEAVTLLRRVLPHLSYGMASTALKIKRNFRTVTQPIVYKTSH